MEVIESKEREMQLTKESCEQIRLLKLLVDHHEQIITTLRKGVHELVQKETGIDIDTGNYVLNLEKGTLDAVTE